MAKKSWLVITIVILGLFFSCAFDVVHVKQEPALHIPLDSGRRFRAKPATDSD